MRNTRRNKDLHEAYIHIHGIDGLNDVLSQLAACTQYAIRHKRSIIFDIQTYNQEELEKIFDFSEFPVRVYTNVKEKLNELKHLPKIPKSRNGKYPIRFDLNRPYPRDVILFYGSGKGGNPTLKNATHRQRHIFEYLRFTDDFIDDYMKVKHATGIREDYIGLHLRSTDRKLNTQNTINGGTEENTIAVKKIPQEENTHQESLKKIEAFIAANPNLPVYVATDNIKLLDKLKETHPNILSSYTALESAQCISNRECNPLHRWVKKEPHVLKHALIDLFLLANASKLMTSAGGFSRLASALSRKKSLVKKLLTK